jgi:hypothetical protein
LIGNDVVATEFLGDFDLGEIKDESDTVENESLQNALGNFIFWIGNRRMVYFGETGDQMWKWLSNKFGRFCFYIQEGKVVEMSNFSGNIPIYVCFRMRGGLLSWGNFNDRVEAEMSQNKEREAMFNWNLRKDEPRTETGGWLEDKLKERKKAQDLCDVEDVTYEEADYE